MMSITIKSPAKINLYLHVIGKDQSNKHLLDTLACFLPDLHDIITIKESMTNKHVIESHGLWKEQLAEPNIIEIALNKIDHLLQKRKFNITLEKNIPIGAGLGGGSGNAAYILNYLIKEYKINISETEKFHIFSEVGADVSLFNYQNAIYAMGIGNIITPVKSFPESLYALIVYPKKSLSTKDVYTRQPIPFTKNILHKYNLDIKTLLNLLNETKNSLYKSSLDLLPELAKIINDITSLNGCLMSRMSGSGSACFGLFKDQKDLDLAVLKFKKDNPNFFITKSRIL